MRFVIITGMSGAGKSQAMKIFEDAGYYCVDNIPLFFVPKFAELCMSSQGKIKRAAVVCDIRGEDIFGQISENLKELKEKGYKYEILFLDANDETLIKRYKETRRKHPLSVDDRLPEAIAKERKMLDEIRVNATHVIDTSLLSIQNLKAKLLKLFSSDEEKREIVINILSFGFKYGIPLDADLVFDVRFLPNPYYIVELKDKGGLSKDVSDYVMSFPQSVEFMNKLFDMMDFLIPHYLEEGKSQVVVAIGCTGGKHRSVTFAEKLGEHLRAMNKKVHTIHRDYKKS
ncbi:MAG: glmZ(sRNA)-inactivating NTPase [Firmicutes bacterium ADurb.Bin193]|nr:MAG: glmZ(sRNA)-inactivating NTPase [Firmicutes bacterium ADurb.Bin193]